MSIEVGLPLLEIILLSGSIIFLVFLASPWLEYDEKTETMWLYLFGKKTLLWRKKA